MSNELVDMKVTVSHRQQLFCRDGQRQIRVGWRNEKPVCMGALVIKKGFRRFLALLSLFVVCRITFYIHLVFFEFVLFF